MKRRLILVLSFTALVSIGAYKAISNISTETSNLKEVVYYTDKSKNLSSDNNKEAVSSNIESAVKKTNNEINKLEDSISINTVDKLGATIADNESITGLDKPSSEPINGSNKHTNSSIDGSDKPNIGNNTNNNTGNDVDKPNNDSVGNMDKPNIEDNTDESVNNAGDKPDDNSNSNNSNNGNNSNNAGNGSNNNVGNDVGTIRQENIDKVIILIDGIDSAITLEDEHSLDKIERSLGDIEAEYNLLSEEEQGLVTNYNKLESAKADMVVIRSQLHLVYDAIIAIPEQITKENLVKAEAAVVKAEEAYGRLKEEHKKGVTPSEYSIIERARWQIERLKETIATEKLDKVINL